MRATNGLKSCARSALRPLWLVIWRRIEARTNTMLDRRMEVLERGDTSWQQHAPAFLNAVSTVGAFGHELLSYRKESLARFKELEDLLADARAEVQLLEAQLAALRAEVQPQEAQLAALRVQVEAQATLREIVDGMECRQQATETRVAEEAARIEFVRREILFEMKYASTGSSSVAPPAGFRPEIAAPDKLELFRQTGLRLNLGCGHIPLDGYLNVDMRALPGVDIIAEVGNVPVEPGSVQELRSAHLLEHFPQEDLRRRLLPYWASLLRPGGTFTAVVPDGEAMLAQSATGNYPFEQFREVLFGAQDYNGDFHFNMFTPDSLQILLKEANFVDVEVPARGRRNGLCYEFEIVARRS
jgi:predicted SAM-dependent methyltransferase